jgi:RNA polymerase subunit RPABC4/transcription elongation factor Spt4
MKCANCGKEFGSGTNCQNCGIDRVTGLGNYSGYNNPTDSSGNYSSNYGGYTSSKTTVCYSCGEIIPSDSEYCPYCSKELYVACPKCGHKYSSQFPACNKCGTNRSQYYRKLEAEKEEARRLEEKRRQEQERNERQHRQQNNQSYLFKIFGFLALIIGGVILVVIITEHGSLSINELMLVIALLIMGIIFLCAKIME